MSEEEQQAWVKAAQQGDELAFEKIYHHHKGLLFNLARQIVKNPADAEDVLQQAFIKVFRSLPRLRDPSKLEPWLRQIVAKTCFDMLRRRKRRPAVPLDEALRQPGGLARNPEEEAMRHLRIDTVQQALDQMSPRYAAYIVLREAHGMKYDEIAEALDEPITTIRVGLFRARKQLRELLRQMAGEDGE